MVVLQLMNITSIIWNQEDKNVLSVIVILLKKEEQLFLCAY